MIARASIARIVLVALAAGVAWSFVAKLPFTGADTYPILAQADRLLHDPGVLVKERYLEGYWEGAFFWRPGLTLFAALEWLLFGRHPLPYHLTRLLLAGVAAWLAGHSAELAPGSRGAAFGTAALVYLLHPVQAETIPVVARDADTLAALALLGAIFFLARARDEKAPAHSWWVGCALALAAPLFKEPGLLGPILGAVALRPWRTRLPHAGLALGVSALLSVGLLAHLGYRLRLLGLVGGYRDTIIELTPAEAARHLLQAIVDHQAIGWTVPVALALFGLAELVAGLHGAPRPPASETWRGVRLGLVSWIVLAATAFVFATRFRTRYAEALLAPIAVLAGAWLGGLVAAGRERALLGRTLARIAPAAGAAALIFAFGTGSPPIYRYPQWALAGRTADAVLSAVGAAARRAAETGAPARVRSGTFEARAERASSGLVLSVEPFPYKVAQPPGRFAGRVSTILIMGTQTIRGYIDLEKIEGVRGVVHGAPKLDVTEEDLEPPVEGQRPAG